MQKSEMAHIMAIKHVAMLASGPRERLVVDHVTTGKPAMTIKVPSMMILATNIMPAGRMEVPSIEDVVITTMPAKIIHGKCSNLFKYHSFAHFFGVPVRYVRTVCHCTYSSIRCKKNITT